MSKLCIIYNFAQHYREPIYKLMEKEWDCEWYFGKNETDIKGISNETLENVTYVDNIKLTGPLWFQKYIGGLIKRKDLEQFLVLGEPFNLSTWWLLFQRRFFFKKKKIYLWTHGWYGKEGIIKRWIKRLYFGMADHIFTYGEYAKTLAVNQGFSELKITPIHNSLNHSYQKEIRENLKTTNVYKNYFKNNNPVIVFIGRLTSVKHLDQLLDAVRILKDKGRYFNVVLIGTGVMEEFLKKLTEQLSLDKQVWFYGACYDDQTNAELIYNADVCVAPGNVGLTAMHSMVFGTPVLTHNEFKWQMPEFEAIKPDRTGEFFRMNDVNSIADTIDNWIKTHQNRDEVRRECYKEIDDNWTPQFQLTVLKKIINN